MACTSCGMIEGFVNDVPSNLAANLPTQELVGMQPSQDNVYMKSECNYAAQPCMYTAQGTLVCPKEGLGACGQKSEEVKPFFGLFQ
jgi:hypothetical protein